MIDAALERHLELVYRRGGSFDPEVHLLGLAARRLARAHALGLTGTKFVPVDEHMIHIGADDGGCWLSTADYARKAGIGARAVLQRIARGKVEARQVGRQWFVKLET